MLKSMFPKAHARYSSVPVVGEFLEGLCIWLHTRGYPRDAIQRRIAAAASLARSLRRQGVRSLSELTAPRLRSFAPRPRPCGSLPQGALVRSLVEYMEELGKLVPTAPTPTERHVAEYRRYLDRVRGLSAGTISMHAGTAAEFLRFLDHDGRSHRLYELRGADVEAFIAKTGKRVGRGRMGQIAAALRTFLRFLATAGEVPPGLDAEVDSPRIYRDERLPRAIPWEAVRAFLRSVDRSTPKGRRDFAMFLLITTYGLRTSEVRALRLDDVAWRVHQFCVPRPKVGTPMLLPLTDEVGTALLDYLQRGRPTSACRHVFLRVEFPLGPLGQGAVGAAFHTWARRAGTVLPARGGPHCLRHALALHLLRQGSALKTIGDILGHRSAESTGVYLRLNVDDLRDVALPLPASAGVKEVRP
jgi:integrase/recombinase XerD